MKKIQTRSFVFITVLIVLTCVALAYTAPSTPGPDPQPVPKSKSVTGELLSLSGRLTQEKVFAGGDGNVSLSLTLAAKAMSGTAETTAPPVDMVVVLDRSGSMEGQKIRDALDAVTQLLSRLGPEDRFALVSYSSDVRKHSELLPLTGANRERLRTEISRIRTVGGTNLGAGLAGGIALLRKGQKEGHSGRMILISDGLANEGITDIRALGSMASEALERPFAISTVGVGYDFNEALMTALADRGTGNYYFLEDPAAFASVFQQEFHHVKTAAATSVEVQIPLKDGVTLTHAGGYPIQMRDGYAVFYPGDVRYSQTRTLFLSFGIPTGVEKTYSIQDIRVAYHREGKARHITLSEPFRIACVKDEKAAVASIRREVWEEKVLQQDYNQLKDEVAADIREGRKSQALGRIQMYRSRQETLNATVGSDRVKENLGSDLEELRETVEETFDAAAPGPPVAEKQRRKAKSLQYEAYQGLRK